MRNSLATQPCVLFILAVTFAPAFATAVDWPVDDSPALRPAPLPPLPAMSFVVPTLAIGRQDQPATEPAAAPPKEPASAPSEEEAPSKFWTFDITYYLYSDYVFRGVNYSDYEHEHGERPNHQATTNLGIDLALLFGREEGAWGTFTFGTFFEWFQDQKRIDPEHPNPLQEVDYYLTWAYEIKPLSTTASLLYNFYEYPFNMAAHTSEFGVKLEHNDAWAWKGLWPDNKDGVLNPWIAYYQDVDFASGGGWLEFGGKHDFPLFQNCTLTPQITLGVDHRYLDRTLATGRAGFTHLAYIQYGLDLAYELSKALKMPERFGTITVHGLLFFNEATGDPPISERLIGDQLFGGMSIGWSI
jgi:hypothetical protein